MMRAEEIIVIQSMLDDGLLVTTSNGGGEITDTGGTWRPAIKHYYIVQGCCKMHSNT